MQCGSTRGKKFIPRDHVRGPIWAGGRVGPIWPGRLFWLKMKREPCEQMFMYGFAGVFLILLSVSTHDHSFSLQFFPMQFNLAVPAEFDR
jgi:hypothetical protein